MKPDEVAALRRRLDAIQPEDGRLTGHPDLKRNEQFTGSNPQARPLLDEIQQRMARNPRLSSFAIPRSITITLNRYGPGMYYQFHADAALLGEGAPIRADLSFSVFLSDPSEYDGGEFHVKTGFGEMVLKEPLGTLICYPPDMPHRVETITRGHRVCAIGWIQSFIRDPDRRKVLNHLGQLHHAVTGGDPKNPHDQSFGQIRNNLLRMWAET